MASSGPSLRALPCAILFLVALMATHPPTVDRIGIAKAFEAGAR